MTSDGLDVAAGHGPGDRMIERLLDRALRRRRQQAREAHARQFIGHASAHELVDAQLQQRRREVARDHRAGVVAGAIDVDDAAGCQQQAVGQRLQSRIDQVVVAVSGAQGALGDGPRAIEGSERMKDTATHKRRQDIAPA